MTDNPVLDLAAPNIKNYVYVKTNVGGWFFDAFLSMTHTSQLTITQHPVQSGAAVSDYAYQQPRQLQMDIGMSDVATSFVPGQFEGSWSRSVKAYKILQQLQQLRIPTQILTRLELYENMLIESLTVPDDYTTLYGLKCTVSFKELLVAKVKTVKVSAKPAVTSQAKKGNQQPVQPTQQQLTSILSYLKSYLTQ